MVKIVNTLFAFSIFLFGCGGEDTLKPEIENKISTAVDFISSESGEFFHVLNGNMGGHFASGSILTVDENGNKIEAIKTPSLGRNLVKGGTGNKYLMASFEDMKEQNSSSLILYNGENPKSLKELKRFQLSCKVANTTLRKDYSYGAVTCFNGDLWLLDISSEDSTQWSLDKVRNYPKVVRRAMYLDKTRELLYLFASDMGHPQVLDKQYEDTAKYGTDGKKISENPSGVPDSFEKSKKIMSSLQEKSHEFQFVVFDLKKAREEKNTSQTKKFVFKEFKDIRSEEMRWLYFKLLDASGNPDDASLASNNKIKLYRSNFWHCEPHPTNENAFFISHRGDLNVKDPGASSNNIVEISISGDPRPKEDGTVPLSDEFFSYKRIFGRKSGDSEKLDYFGPFSVRENGGDIFYYVNSFRDPKNFTDESFYAIYLLSQEQKVASQIDSKKLADSYYGIALGKNSFLTSYFYKNQLVLGSLGSGKSLEITKKIQ